VVLSTVTTYLKDAVYGQKHMTGGPNGEDNSDAHSGSINHREFARSLPQIPHIPDPQRAAQSCCTSSWSAA
jgi:hypothetical protein